MALVKCKDCEKEFSTDAKKCPNCGACAPVKSKVPILLLIFFILGGGMQLLANADNQYGPSPETIKNQERLKIIGAAGDAAAAIRNSMRNPDSFKVISIAYNKDANIFCYEYRAENGFGGMNAGHVIYNRNNDEFVQENSHGFSKKWNKDCTASANEPISANTVNAGLKYR